MYAGGYFRTAGGRSANYIAQWNGSSWSALGPGLSSPPGLSPTVLGLAVSGGTGFPCTDAVFDPYYDACIAAGTPVRKYGEVIGSSAAPYAGRRRRPAPSASPWDGAMPSPFLRHW